LGEERAEGGICKRAGRGRNRGSYATMRFYISQSREEAKEKGEEAIIAVATLR